MSLRIGEIRADDIEDAVDLWRETGLLRPWNDARADLRLALKNPSSTVLAGYVEDRLAATAMVGFDGHRGWVYYLAVRREFARRGHGARMMGAAEDWLKAQGAPKLNLMVRAENEAVIAFYEKLGYRRADIAVLQRALD